MLTDYILIILLLYWGNTTPETEKTHHEPPVNAQAIVEEIDYCTLDVISCDDWQEGEFTAYSSGDGFTPSETMASGKAKRQSGDYRASYFREKDTILNFYLYEEKYNQTITKREHKAKG